MIAAVFLLLGAAVLWTCFLVVQVIVSVTLFTLLLWLIAMVVIYGVTFLGLFLIFGPVNAGWAIFGAMFIGTVLCKTTTQSLIRHAQ